MPAFAYTIGLHGIGHPELLVFGLGSAHAGRSPGVPLGGGVVTPRDRALDRPLLVESLPNPGDILVQANNYYPRPSEGSVDAVQLSWCDPLGRWPGDPACLAPAATQPRPGSFRA